MALFEGAEVELFTVLIPVIAADADAAAAMAQELALPLDGEVAQESLPSLLVFHRWLPLDLLAWTRSRALNLVRSCSHLRCWLRLVKRLALPLLAKEELRILLRELELLLQLLRLQ